jgi:FkbM family methyltransferase
LREEGLRMVTTLESAPARADETLVNDTGLVRVRRCRDGLLAYITHDSYIGRSLDLYGEFSRGEAKLFEQLVRPGMTVLDVGANIGAHTVRLAQLVGPRGRVIAYEPQRVIFQLMCANVGMNGLFNVHPRLAAAGSLPGRLTVPPVNYAVAGNYGGLSLGGYQEGEEVPIETLDSLNLPACHFMKIDVEGMEAETIKGAVATLRRHRPLLYMENDRKEKSAALIELMFAQDYRLYWHLTPYYAADNYLKNADNVFKGIISINMLAVPRESALKIVGLPEITAASDSWTVHLAKS